MKHIAIVKVSKHPSDNIGNDVVTLCGKILTVSEVEAVVDSTVCPKCAEAHNASIPQFAVVRGTIKSYKSGD